MQRFVLTQKFSLAMKMLDLTFCMCRAKIPLLVIYSHMSLLLPDDPFRSNIA